ncbi:hypothetical protein EMCRGX_G032461 [Ephydatia muelleri]|eukprot:Em0019g236a
MYTSAFAVLLLVSCVAAAPRHMVHTTPWKDCGSTTVALTNVSVSGCNSAPCKVQRGSNITAMIYFTPKQTYASLTNAVYGLIGGVPIPFPLTQASVCELGATCPVEVGTDYVETVVIDVLSSYPCLQLIVEWKLKDPSGNEVSCFEVPLQITC